VDTENREEETMKRGETRNIASFTNPSHFAGGRGGGVRRGERKRARKGTNF